VWICVALPFMVYSILIYLIVWFIFIDVVMIFKFYVTFRE
jgi:hypothetical protein